MPLSVKIKRPQGQPTREAKERILFLLCLANFCSRQVKKFAGYQMWERFRKGHFVFTADDCFFEKILTPVVWREIFSFYMISIPLVVEQPCLCFDSEEAWFANDWRYYGYLYTSPPYGWSSDNDPWESDDDYWDQYLPDDYFEYTGAWHPTFSFYGDTHNLKHYGYEDEGEDSMKEVNQELWDRKKRRHDHTPKRRWKQKFRRRKENVHWEIEI